MARSTTFIKVVRSISIIGGLSCIAIILFLLPAAKQASLAKPLSSSPPTLLLPQTDVITGPIVLTAGAGGAWYHNTRIFTDKAYNVDVAGEGNVGLRVSYLGIDLTGLQLNFFADAEDLNDWHFNRWEGGVQMGLCTADNLAPPPPQENVAMGPHMKNSAGALIYANPSPNQGANTWWAPDPPGSYWNAADPVNSGYDVRPGHGQVVNYAGKGFYVFPDAPFTDPLEGDIIFTGEYDGNTSNHWYRKDSIVPHPEWVTGTSPTPEQIHAVNTFDMVIDYTPLIINGRTDYKRYKVEWWYRKHQSAAALEGGPFWWVPDANDPSGGWIQPTTTYWYFGGYASDGTLTGQDEPGFDFSAVFPYLSAFGWWRDDQPEQTVVVQQIVIEYIAGSESPGDTRIFLPIIIKN